MPLLFTIHVDVQSQAEHTLQAYKSSLYIISTNTTAAIVMVVVVDALHKTRLVLCHAPNPTEGVEQLPTSYGVCSEHRKSPALMLFVLTCVNHTILFVCHAVHALAGKSSALRSQMVMWG